MNPLERNHCANRLILDQFRHDRKRSHQVLGVSTVAKKSKRDFKTLNAMFIKGGIKSDDSRSIKAK